MVQTGTTNEIDGNPKRPPRKPKKSVKKKSTFYPLPVVTDCTGCLPMQAVQEDEIQGSTTKENSDLFGVTESCVNSFEDEKEDSVNYQIKTRKSESHWYMIYYDGSVNISEDEEEGDNMENSGFDEVDGTSIAQARLPFVYTLPVFKEKADEEDVMVNGIIFNINKVFFRCIFC